MNKTQIIILAAGHGKRMGSKIPKALTLFKGKPFLMHLLDTIKESKMCENPIIVIGQKGDQVRDFLGEGYTYAIQKEQLGTGHAVMSVKDLVHDVDSTLVLYADTPLISKETIKNIISIQKESKAAIAMATTIVPDFNGWRSAFISFGRIIRDINKEIIKIVEFKDARDNEKEIKEVNPAYMCFENKWLWENLSNLKNSNSQNEYYLTDLISLAFSQNKKISTVLIDPKEALGVNTREQLDLIENI